MRATGIVGLAGLALLLAAEPALACSCAATPAKEQLRRADGAVVAKLIAVEPIDDGDEVESSGDRADFVYRIRRRVKGGPRLRKGRRLVVRSVRSTATCGLPDGVGERYGLFLDRTEARWTSGLCQTIEPADMRRLDEGKEPAARSTCA